jgi:hypothetical protein
MRGHPRLVQKKSALATARRLKNGPDARGEAAPGPLVKVHPVGGMRELNAPGAGMFLVALR